MEQHSRNRKISDVRNRKVSKTMINISSSPPLKSGNEKVQIQRSLGLWSGVFMIIGSIIGSGIWVTPGFIMMYSESVAIYMLQWVFSGVLATLGKN